MIGIKWRASVKFKKKPAHFFLPFFKSADFRYNGIRMGAFLDKPKTEKYNESKTGAGLRYGLSSMQGWRIEMEDAHSAIIGIPGANFMSTSYRRSLQ